MCANLIYLIERKRETRSEKLLSLYIEYLKIFSSAPRREGLQLQQLKRTLQIWHSKLNLLLAQETGTVLHLGSVCIRFLVWHDQLIGQKAGFQNACFNTRTSTLAGNPVHIEQSKSPQTSSVYLWFLRRG